MVTIPVCLSIRIVTYQIRLIPELGLIVCPANLPPKQHLSVSELSACPLIIIFIILSQNSPANKGFFFDRAARPFSRK